ncbi:aminomethyl transferase domain containing protein [Plasmodium gonderi]|uniref:Aminomethyl transferase domain containing protein n=1 Tax=Plasmodium gonderi TaxID=77519 RepID=A0A1Y1JM73_PLAGO|nr:aminomethyl transferase domain containing protein [Plasmodium gonderi]GAW82565.1 aminomethyl transferase domain containing protein [Plasmodium gonderi]
MNKYHICKLKSRTLIQICGTDSFKFLQSLTTNDLNKIITEKKFILYKNVPKNVLSNPLDANTYQIYNPSLEHKKLTKGLPSLFLQNNGKILFDCFIYNIRYMHEQSIFSLFYIDCNVNILKILLNILQKRKLSCDVHVREIPNIAVHQLVSGVSVLGGRIITKDSTIISDDSAIQSLSNNDIERLSNNLDILFLSKDGRNDILGYRIYEIRGKEQKEENENINKNTGILKKCVSVTASNITNESNSEINSKFKNDTYHILLNFEKEEKVKLADTFVYDYIKLNLGVVENLYSYCPPFIDNIQKNTNDVNTPSVISTNEYLYIDVKQNKEPRKGDRDIFKFKDLSPFDLNYDKLNYLTKDKGCYVGQEAINRIRNEIFINKYQLTLCVNYDYYEMLLGNWDNLSKSLLVDSIYHKYVKLINDKNLFKLTFFLLKNALKSLEDAINYEQLFNVIIQKNCTTNKVPTDNDTIGNVFFYNHVIGLCFLIRKRIAHLSDNIYSATSNIYIKNKVDMEQHRICLLPFKFNSNTF